MEFNLKTLNALTWVRDHREQTQQGSLGQKVWDWPQKAQQQGKECRDIHLLKAAAHEAAANPLFKFGSGSKFHVLMTVSRNG